MSKIKLLTISVVGLLFINILMVTWFFVQRGGENDNGLQAGQAVGPKDIIIQRLGFDNDQKARYELLIKQHRLTIRNLNDSISATKNTLYGSLKNTQYTGTDSLLNKLALLQERIELTHYNHFVDIRRLCKPSQMDNFNALTKDLSLYFNSQKKSTKFQKN